MKLVADTELRLVADIGGTHARFALLSTDGEPTQIQNLKTADFKNLADAIHSYLSETKLDVAWRVDALSAVVSIAAPLAGDRVRMTNAAWDFSIEATKQELGLKSLRLVNDFEALALAVPTLQSNELMAIGHESSQDHGSTNAATKAIIGPGTGLGMAGVTPIKPVTHNGQTIWHALPCEGGHASVAPANPREAALLQASWNMGYKHICWEDWLSGTGLPLLHRAVCSVDGFDYQPLTPAHIGEAALLRQDAACLATLQTFCAMLGSAAGDLALMTGARGGVYIKGGVLDRVLELAPNFLEQSAFRDCFCAKGAYQSYMQAIPTWFIKTPQIALRGCATLL